MNHVLETVIGGRTLKLEHGKVGMLSDCALFLSYGDTVIMTNVNASKEPRAGVDFFPLSVEFEERLYAAGKIPGGFTRKEGRAADKAILAARAIDRPLRPLFPKGFRNDVQIINTIVSVEQDNRPDIVAMNAASLAVCLSSIPFNGPVGSVSVGLIDGEFVLNPTLDQRDESTLDLTVCATKEKIMMIEAGGDEIDEETMINAIDFGFEKAQELIAFQEEAIAKFGKEKVMPELHKIDGKLEEFIREVAFDDLKKAMYTVDKDERGAAVDAAKQMIFEKLPEEFEDMAADVGECVYNIQKEIIRHMLIVDKRRPDERPFDKVRPLGCEVSVLPRTHGTGLFTRGLTQVMTVATLGPLGDAQMLDDLSLETEKRYMHHYNFPAYSVGEVRPLRGPGRREIGHGALAEKALEPLIPSKEDFPYTIRLVSEVLSSNGSTSQASVCGSTLALLDAGVPIKRPAAGIAMGLITNEDLTEEHVLTDIQGIEDFFGDMDFKVAGTEKGITSIQVDTKLEGLSNFVVRESIEKARIARMTILDEINACIPATREELSEYAPRMITLQVNPDKIRDIIGPGGKVIKQIIADTGVSIDTNDDGKVVIMSTDAENANKAVNIIKDITREVEEGEIYLGKVTRIMNFGAFVEVLPGKEGLCHISKLDVNRVNKVEDVVSVGDEILVKVVEIDNQGRVNLSRKDAIAEAAADKETETEK